MHMRLKAGGGKGATLRYAASTVDHVHCPKRQPQSLKGVKEGTLIRAKATVNAFKPSVVLCHVT